jgi:hypothetical protein
VPKKQHLLSIDDAPFDKYRDETAWVIGVVTAGPSLIEGMLTTKVPVDGDGITGHLTRWVKKSRFFPSLRAILMQGLTMAGLSVIDLPSLHSGTGLPVISVERKVPRKGRLEGTLLKLGLEDRAGAVKAAGPFHPFEKIVFACAGLTPAQARATLSQACGRSHLPEGIRVAHLLGQALILGESRGRP